MAVGLRVARVGARDDVRQSWTIVDANGLPVDAPEAFLAHLTNIERSPNTVEAYARDLCQFLRFLAQRGVAYSDANIGLLGAWVASLRVPSDNVLVLNGEDVFVRKASTVTRKIRRSSASMSSPPAPDAAPRRREDVQVVPPPRWTLDATYGTGDLPEARGA
jgi:integrase/recombinase XerD